MAGGGVFLGAGGGILRDLSHLFDGLDDLLDTTALVLLWKQVHE